ncbi:hypothetical protein [uncultured Duncaniella sp.]|nr:hypothetical protein [uncultured Duncaniella sp.]
MALILCKVVALWRNTLSVATSFYLRLLSVLEARMEIVGVVLRE